MPRTLVLLHGLGRTARSMRPLERAATERGFRVLNLDYPSRLAAVGPLARWVARAIRAASPAEPLDFVTHSMGGILLRAAVASGYLSAARVRRAVLLAPPSRGSEVADALARTPLLRAFTGPAGRDLCTGDAGIPERLPPICFDCGIIAGSRSLNPLFSRVLGGPNDGKVSVARARADGMRDFLVVRRGHTFIMHAPDVIEQVFHFLDHGTFARAA